MVKDWRLNERHYGGLTGLNKAETAALHGEDQVKVWRRSYDVPPPELAPGGEYDFASRPPLRRHALPSTESLKTTLDRVQPYWDAEIAPKLKAGETVLVAAHGNSPARHRQAAVQCARRRHRRCRDPDRQSAAHRSGRRAEAGRGPLSGRESSRKAADDRLSFTGNAWKLSVNAGAGMVAIYLS
jgi:hypothetical protein